MELFGSVTDQTERNFVYHQRYCRNSLLTLEKYWRWQVSDSRQSTYLEFAILGIFHIIQKLKFVLIE